MNNAYIYMHVEVANEVDDSDFFEGPESAWRELNVIHVVDRDIGGGSANYNTIIEASKKRYNNINVYNIWSSHTGMETY